MPVGQSNHLPRPLECIIPVIDLKEGVVVHAVRGDRETYAPVKSCFATDACPDVVAHTLVERFQFQSAYVADLDAIGGAEPAWNDYRKIAEAGLRLLVDAGVGDRERAQKLRSLAETTGMLDGIVVGLESVETSERLSEILAAIGISLAVFSLDLRKGVPLVDHAKWPHEGALEIAGDAIRCGYRRIIVLDLAAVGSGEGPASLETCHAIRSRFPNIELISGGGIRSVPDVRALHTAGCDRVLVASALHNGQISTDRYGSG